MDCRTNRLSDQWTVGPMDCMALGSFSLLPFILLLFSRSVGPMDCRTNGLSDCGTNGLYGSCKLVTAAIHQVREKRFVLIKRGVSSFLFLTTDLISRQYRKRRVGGQQCICYKLFQLTFMTTFWLRCFDD